MLTCIACSKQLGGGPLHDLATDDDDHDPAGGTPSTRQAIKSLTAQVGGQLKDMAVKASGAYRHCKPCAGSGRPHGGGTGGGAVYADSDGASGSDRFHHAYRRAVESTGSTPRAYGREMEARLRALSSGEGTPSISGRTETGSSWVFMEEEDEPKEWVAQVEAGVLITFLSLPQGGNDLKRIRFSREMFNRWQAQRWWAENYDKVMELYNVQRFNRQDAPLPIPPGSEDESSKEDSPVTPPLNKERLPHNFHRPLMGGGGGGAMGYTSSDSLEHRSSHHCHHHHGRYYHDSGGLTSTLKLSSISGAKMETSSMDASVQTSSSPADQSGEPSVAVSNASDQEREWVEEDAPGVYITIQGLPGGIRELRRVRFSRERFGELHARMWWEENRARIHEQYL
ncbi:protein Brevis radix-like 1 isoform X1 [Elaeis guineensis]|uniref:protein Brevis radix-like 1 isoform X1 n=1 Tax=Elaeis guineensis var. tenera TaxID=51953 RepID=UPI003C6CDF2C